MNLEIDLKEQLTKNNMQPFPKPLPKISNIPFDFDSLLSKISSEPYDSSLFSSLQTEFNPIMEEETMNLLAKDDPFMIDVIFSIEKAARTHLKGFDVKKTADFNFQLPPSAFTSLSKKLLVSHNKEDSNEYLSTSDLTCNQRCEIFKTGKFIVKSKKFKQDYIWKMSTWIIQGRENINKHIKEDMKSARNMLKGWFKAFYRSETHDLFEANIYNGMKYSWYFVRNLISIFLGYPKVFPVETDSTGYFVCDHMLQLIEDETVDKKFWRSMFEKKKDNNVMKENDNYLHLKHMEEKFEAIWKKQKHIEEKKLVDDENLKVKLLEVFYTQLDEYILTNNTIINKEDLSKLLEFYKCLRIIHAMVFKYEIVYNDKITMFSRVLKENHPFLCKFKCYYERKYSEYQHSEREALKIERNEKILHEFSDLKFQEQHKLFSKFLKFLDFYYENHQAANYLLLRWQPYRDFDFTVYLFPSSWKVENYTDNQGQILYHLIRTDTITYSTEHWFWRFFIMLIRYRVWVQNAMYWLFVMAIASPLGIRALCGFKPFHPDKECDLYTGVIRQARNPEYETVISTFLLVMKSISDDRDHFENQPDTGFFGKKFSRICNLIYNYIFKFIFVGLFLTLVCFPILIIFNFVISLFLAVTSFLWMPFALILFKIFQVLIYDIDNEGAHQGHRSNTFHWFPLISEFMITFGIFCFLQIVFAIFLLIIKPILFVLIVILGILRYVLRSIYDVFMMLFVLLFGRVPASDTAIAWKISGPVVSRKYYDKMELFDALMVYLAKLEKIELQRYQNEVQAKLRINQTEVEKFYRNLNNPFGVASSLRQYDDNNKNIKKDVANMHTLKTCQEILQKKLDMAMNDRKYILPDASDLYNVRFNAKELEILEACCLDILKTFVSRRNIQDNWPEKDFGDMEVVREINRNMIRDSLNSYILEPFEELDERVELIDIRPDFGAIDDVLKGKTGNELENLGVRIVKERKMDEIAVKYLTVENPIPVITLGQFYHSVDLVNGVKVDVTLTELHLKMAQELREIKPEFKEINRKHNFSR